MFTSRWNTDVSLYGWWQCKLVKFLLQKGADKATHILYDLAILLLDIQNKRTPALSSTLSKKKVMCKAIQIHSNFAFIYVIWIISFWFPLNPFLYVDGIMVQNFTAYFLSWKHFPCYYCLYTIIFIGFIIQLQVNLP